MPEFLAEAYVARTALAASGSQARDLARAADRMARQGRRVRLTGCVFVPDDEIGWYLFQAPSADAVHDAAASCGMRFERVVEAVSGWLSEKDQHRIGADQQ